MHQKLPTEEPKGITIKSINTLGKDGKNYHFLVEQIAPYLQYPHEKPVHCFRIKVDESSFDWFVFNVIENVDELKIIAMAHNYQPEYRGKGIPEEMIRCASKWLSKTVVSSSNLRKVIGKIEFRSEMADGVWKRLVSTDEAHYNTNRDIYVYPLKEESVK